MIDVPYADAVEKIVSESGKSKDEVEQKVEEKLKELSGLISKDGAVHIVANELGVQLVAPVVEGQELKIKELTPHSRGATVTGKVVQRWDVKEFDKNGRKGKVANLLLGDETGVMRLTFWNDQVDVFQELKDGDVLIVKNPFVKQGWQDRLEMQLNDQSTLDVNPQGVTVEVKPREEQAPREQKYIKDLSGEEKNVEIVATLVQVYDPRFYDACPECRKKLTENICPEHGEVKGTVNFNMAAFLDDGTGNIRTSFWKKQAIVLTGKSEEDFLKYRDDPTAFEEVKTDLLGEIIKIVGTVKKNETFDRMELNAQLVFMDVDPAKELANLEKKAKTSAETVVETPEKPVVKEEVISLEDL